MWKRESGYHRRSCMFRLKVIYVRKLRRRKFDAQAVELFIQCAIPKRMIQTGQAKSYKVEF